MIWALSRYDAETMNPGRDGHLVISITDPDSTDANPETSSTRAILRLKFDDFHTVPTGPSFKSVIGRDLLFFTREIADEVVRFLRAHRWRDLVCHCEAGASRSVAMAHAVSKHYCMDYANAPLGLTNHHVGNPLVYWVLAEALRR